MASKYEKWVNRSLYECQMFGFTSKAFLDFVYNVVSKAAGDAIVEVDRQISDHPEFSSMLDKDTREKCFEKVKEMLDKRLDINIDRLELFARHNTFLIPQNVVLPSDKVQEDFHDTKTDEEDIDQRTAAVIKEIVASYKMRIALQKDLSSLGDLKSMADELLNDIDQSQIPSKEDISLTCQNLQSFIDTLKTLEQTGTEQNLVELS